MNRTLRTVFAVAGILLALVLLARAPIPAETLAKLNDPTSELCRAICPICLQQPE